MSDVSFIFFGTDDFAVAVLEELKKAGFVPVLIVAPPDKPKGRGLVLTPPQTKEWARKYSIPVLQPEKFDASFSSQLSMFNASIFIVASYGLIIPQSILDIPSKGTLNVHPSLLPFYRGATPVESQIYDDAKDIGVTVMLMDAKMDHGPIVAQSRTQLTNNNRPHTVPTARELTTRLAKEGGKLLSEVIPEWVEGKIKAMQQDHTRATYTKKLTKADGEISLADDGYKNFLKIRAFDGSIGTFFFVEKADRKIRVIVKDAEYADGKLTITRVIPENKKEMGYDEFLLGQQ